MTKNSECSIDLVSLETVSTGLSVASTALYLADRAGVPLDDADKYVAGLKTADNALTTGTSILAGGSAVIAASSLTVAATSGAGIATGLAAAGGVIGGGMAAGPAAIAAGPTYLLARTINRTFFAESEDHNSEEANARRKARLGTKVGGATGIAAVGATVLAGGASGSAIMGTLATVGGLVGGGALAGTAVLVAAPFVLTAAGGYGFYRLFGGGKKNSR